GAGVGAPDGGFVGKLPPPTRPRCRGTIPPPAVNDDFGCAAANVEQTAAEVAFILCKASFGGSKRLEHCVADQNSRSIRGSDEILRCDCGRRDNVHVRLKVLTDHADSVADSVMCIDDEFMWKNVQNFAIVGKSDIAGRFDGPLHVIAFDVAWTIA